MATKAAPAKSKLNNFSDIKANDLMALVNFVRVDSVNQNRKTLAVTDLSSGMSFDVEGAEIAEQMFSADRFVKEEKKTATELVEILEASFNIPFTVTYIKKDGATRVLRGKMVRAENKMGRSDVLDLDVTSGNPLRQVDHRTIQSIIVGGVKYTLKK